MCDYSLESYQSRPAIAGEDLDLVRFPSGSQGFVGHGAATSCAVCCEEGMTMTLHMPSGDVDVVFSKDRRPMLSWVSEPSFRHKDGVRFPDGSYRLLQELPGDAGDRDQAASRGDHRSRGGNGCVRTRGPHRPGRSLG